MDHFAITSSSTPAWLDTNAYPFGLRRMPTADGDLSYVDVGTGAPVLFVHGTPSWSFEWRHSIAALAGRARCVAVDHLGFGLSDKPPGAPYRPADHSRRLLELVRALDLRELSLVVHDFGGPIGLSLLRDEPERVARVVVINSWAWAHGDDPRVARLSRMVRSGFGRWLYRRLNASPRWLLPASFSDRSKLDPATHAHYLGPFPDPDSREAPWVLGCELAGSDADYAAIWTATRAELRRRPLDLIWGLDDPAFGPGYLDRWVASFPHATITKLAGVGHFPQEEAPELVNAALERALLGNSLAFGARAS